MSVVPAPRASSDAPAPAAPLAPALDPALARALDALADDGWTVLHGLRWPARLRRPVDLALVGPGGVLVVDVRPWPAAAVMDGAVRAGRRTRDRECRAAARAGAAVATLLHAEHHDAVRAVLCLTAASVPPTSLSSGALVLAAADLHGWASALPPRLDDGEVRLLAEHLRWQLGEHAGSAGSAGSAGPAGPTSPAGPPAAQPTDQPAEQAVDRPDGVPAVVVPVTRRALREAERLAEQRGRRGHRVIGRPVRSRRDSGAARR